MIGTYDKGEVLRITGTFRNLAGTPIDPDVPMFSVRTPSGAFTTYSYPADAEIVRSSAGVYYMDLHFVESGSWFVRHWSTGAGEASGEKEYLVLPSAFG